MARNRKRAKDRRARRPQGGSIGQPGLATARRDDLDAAPDAIAHAAPDPIAHVAADPIDDAGPDPVDSAASDPIDNAAPEPLAHAAPDAELAEAQLALGRPDLAGEPVAEPDLEDEYELDDEGAGEERPPSAPDFDSEDVGGGPAPNGGSELAVPGGSAAAPRARSGNRLIGFLQGSWAELQRVQWPDRRQVMQATGVVIGFVIVAGAFLGVADFLAGKLVNFILK